MRHNGAMLSAPTDTPAHPAQTDPGPAWRQALAALGPAFYARVDPQPLQEPYWIDRNAPLARELGLDGAWLQSRQALLALSGCAVAEGSEPIASVYSGHQFGVWAGQLGDGRALILGEIQTAAGSVEIQIKGGGRTPFSRMGDGRAVLRSSIREYLCSEAMHGLRIPTTRALALTGSPSRVLREEVETAAVVTRTAPSFLRFGHFEHFSHSGQTDQLRQLADHVIDRFYPECRSAASPYAALLGAVVQRTAHLLAQWQAVGFCHGVMNTDNMSMLGLTLDYGPFQFLDAFDPDHICNHSDSQGRYAYKRQPSVAHWNLYALGQALLPLIGAQDDALAALDRYRPAFESALTQALRAKLGLTDAQQADDLPLIEQLLQLMAASRLDHTLFWRRLCDFGEQPEPVRDLFVDRAGFDAWALRYRARCTALDRDQQRQAMRAVNPRYVLRNYLGEQAIAAAKQGDFAPMRRLLTVLQAPFDDHPDHEDLADLPPDWAASIEISCSS
jgi:uncharacterized protein YdiU (UPF0061 family)